jgi:hypothetical protein
MQSVVVQNCSSIGANEGFMVAAASTILLAQLIDSMWVMPVIFGPGFPVLRWYTF